MFEFKLPDVGEGIHEAEIRTWLVAVGDTVAQDQPILEIETDKAVVEIPSPVAGTIAEIKAGPGTLAHLGDVLVLIAANGEPAAAPPPAPVVEAPPPPPKTAPPPAPAETPGIPGPGLRVLAAPAVRRMALEMGIDLRQVPGSGPAGRILPDDLHRFAAAPPPSPPKPAAPAPPAVSVDEPRIEERPLQGLRRRIAERMEIAWRIPHVTSFEEVEVSNLVALRQSLKPEAARHDVRLTFTAFIVKIVTRILKELPDFNATLDMEAAKILYHRDVHIGVAAAIPEGLLVPVIRHADRLSLLEIAAELSRLSALAQERKLAPAELSGSTFSITNYGSFGAWHGTPIINAPEVAILGVGRIEDRPVAVDGQVVVRPVMPLALSYDHRLIDGAAAGQFLARLKTLLSNPNYLLLELR